MQENITKEFTTRFVKQPGYKTIIVDGVLGGFNNTGKLNMNFYIDSIIVPEKVTIKFNPETNQPLSSQNIEGMNNSEIIKEIPLTISMNYALSKMVLNWLTEQIRTFEKANPDIKI